MKATYTLKVAGLTRELPLCPVNEHLDIAAFVMFTDVELTVACAAELIKRVPEHDVILTADVYKRQAIARAVKPMSINKLMWLCLKSCMRMRFTPVYLQPWSISRWR